MAIILHNITVFYFIFYQINAAMLNIRGLFEKVKKKLPTPNFWTVVYYKNKSLY